MNLSCSLVPKANIDWKVWDEWHAVPQIQLNFLSKTILNILETNPYFNREKTKNLNILDLGTGTAIISAPLIYSLYETLTRANWNLTVLGVDCDKKIIPEMEQNMKTFQLITNKKKVIMPCKQNPIYNFRKVDILDESFYRVLNGYSFDIIFMIDFIHYIPSKKWNQVKKFFEDKLTPSGFLIVGIPIGDIKFITGDSEKSNGMKNEVKEFWHSIHEIFSKYKNKNNYIGPTQTEECIQKLFEQNYNVVSKISLWWLPGKTYIDILQLYECEAMSFFRIHIRNGRNDIKEELNKLQTLISTNSEPLLFGKKLIIYQKKAN